MNETIGSTCASYLDYPSTTQTVYYTIAVKCRLGEGYPEYGNETWYINRAHVQGDAFRPAPMSSWTAQEIWKGSTIIANMQSSGFS